MSSQSLSATPLSFDVEQKRAISRHLRTLARHIDAQLVMLADISGRLIQCQGRLSEEKCTGLASLAAAIYGASNEISDFLGLDHTYGQQLHEGEHTSLYIVAVGDELLLVIAFTHRTKLGMVRLFTQRAQQQLLPIASAAAAARNEATPATGAGLGADFGDSIDAQFDELFGQNGA